MIYICALGFLIFVLSSSWKRLIKFVLFWLVIEGAIRKWVFPQAGQSIYFVKDLITLVAYYKFFFLSSHKLKKLNITGSLSALLAVTTLICFVQIFNTNLSSPIVGLFGFRAYLLYVPLMFVAPYLFETKGELLTFLKSYLLLMIPIGLLGFAQYASSPSALINAYARGDEGVVAANLGAARITGTFSYLSGYGTFLQLCATLALSLVSIRQKITWRICLIGILGLIVINILMTASRGPLIAITLMIFGYFIFDNSKLLLRNIIRIVIPMSLVGLVIVNCFSVQWEAYVRRATESDQVSGRVTASFYAPVENFQYAGVIGYGVGATHQATPIIRSIFKLPEGALIPVGYENEPGRVMLELGLIGFVLWYGLRTLVILALWRTYRRLRSPDLKKLALATFLFHLVNISSVLVFQVTLGVYYWLLAGFVYLLPRLEARETWRRQAGVYGA